MYSNKLPEVTQDEFMETFVIHNSNKFITAWRKDVRFRDANGKEYELILNWDEDNGYLAYWPNDDKPSMADRPEFEYIVDSITADMELDRDNPWDWYDFTENK